MRDQQQRAAVVAQPGLASQITASRSRWLVGSSSSSRSERHISACARFRRMRQPPEKSATGRSMSDCRKPRPSSSRRRARANSRRSRAGGRGVPDVRTIVRSFGRSSSASMRRSWRRRRARSRSPAAPAGRFLRDVGDHPARRQVEVALIGVELVAQQGEQAGFAAAVGAGEADLPAGWICSVALSMRTWRRARGASYED